MSFSIFILFAVLTAMAYGSNVQNQTDLKWNTNIENALLVGNKAYNAISPLNKNASTTIKLDLSTSLSFSVLNESSSIKNKSEKSFEAEKKIGKGFREDLKTVAKIIMFGFVFIIILLDMIYIRTLRIRSQTSLG